MPSISFLKSIALASVLALGVGAAQAATYNFSFTTGATVKTTTGPEVTPLDLDGVAGASFLASAAKTVTLDGTVTTTVGSGLGLNLLGTDTGLNSPKTLSPISQYTDANGTTLVREMLIFTFTRAVRLVSVTLASVTDLTPSDGKTPFVGFFVNPSTAPGGAPGFINTDVVAANGDVSAPGGANGSSFGIGARMNGAFYIAGITVEDIPTEVSPVPLPAGGLLLGSLALVPFLRRKRRA